MKKLFLLLILLPFISFSSSIGPNPVDAPLTNFGAGSNTPITSSDSILSGLEKAQAQITQAVADSSAALALKANLAGGNTITGTQNFSGGTIVFDAGGETRFGIGGYVDPDVGTQYNIKYGGAGRSMAVRGISYFLDQMGIGAQTPVASAKLQVSSTTQGFLPPTMTTAQMNAIASPEPGLQIYNTDIQAPCYYDGTTWIFELNFVMENNQATTSSTYGSLTELTTPSLPVGRYRFEVSGAFQSTSVLNGIGIRLGAGSATISAINAMYNIAQAGNGTDAFYNLYQLSPTENSTNGGVLTANADFPASGSGVFSLSGAGTVALQLRSENNGTGVSARINTVLTIRKIKD